MSEERPVLPEEISEGICHGSAQRRSQALEKWFGLPDRVRAFAVPVLLSSPYRDVREMVLEVCTPDVVSNDDWRDAVDAAIGDDAVYGGSPDCTQGLLIIMRRMMCDFTEKMTDYYRRCLDSDDVETQYQAFCLAEIREDEGAAYESRVKKWLSSDDEDFRIVAAQAVVRLNPSWGIDALKARYARTTGLEAFHLRLGLVRLCPEDERGEYVTALIDDVEDSHYSFAAIEALSRYGTDEAVPALLRVARSFFGEPTVRVAAAGAAARIGSEQGIQLLNKFAAARHGNPEYARQLLDLLDTDNNKM